MENVTIEQLNKDIDFINGATALVNATRNEHIEIAKAIERVKGFINKQGDTATATAGDQLAAML